MKNESFQRGEEIARFRKQFSDKEWKKLTSNAEFAKAWAIEDLVAAGETASRLLYGNVHSAETSKKLRLYD